MVKSYPLAGELTTRDAKRAPVQDALSHCSIGVDQMS
jgi:hypothetical protein